MGASCYLFSCPTAIPSIYGAQCSWGLAESHQIPLPSLHGGEGSLFPGFVPPNGMVNSGSVVGVKHGDFGVMIGYQVDVFTHTWLVESCFAHSHIYPCFTGELSTLTHFLLEPHYDD